MSDVTSSAVFRDLVLPSEHLEAELDPRAMRFEDTVLTALEILSLGAMFVAVFLLNF